MRCPERDKRPSNQTEKIEMNGEKRRRGLEERLGLAGRHQAGSLTYRVAVSYVTWNCTCDKEEGRRGRLPTVQPNLVLFRNQNDKRQ